MVRIPVLARIALAIALVLGTGASPGSAAGWPTPVDGTYIVPEFRFADGETMKNLRLHYVTLGTPHRDRAGLVDNAVLVLHGTGGDTTQFLSDRFAGVLFAPNGVLDAAKYFIVITDGIGHGTSSKPSDGMHAHFPHYGYRDMVRAQHDVLVDALHVGHLKLVMGTSMGGMQTWLWGETYPGMMDALMPLASLPVQIGGRNRVWRDMIVDDLRSSPDYAGGEYTAQPSGLKAAVDVLWIFGSAPVYDQSLFPTRDQADEYYEQHVKPLAARYDANDMIYQFESSRDYDPQADLGKIVAPLLAVNSDDDQINPPELRILERNIKNVLHGRYVLLPVSTETRGHGTHTVASIWKDKVDELLRTRVNLRLRRLPGGAAQIDEGTTLVLPPGWTAAAYPTGVHEYVYELRPPSGTERLDVTLSGAIYFNDPSFTGTPYCVNGLRGRIREYGDDRFVQLAVSERRMGAHYIYLFFRKGDAAAQHIARSLRVAGVSGRC